jgi:hypothetical protein
MKKNIKPSGKRDLKKMMSLIGKVDPISGPIFIRPEFKAPSKSNKKKDLNLHDASFFSGNVLNNLIATNKSVNIPKKHQFNQTLHEERSLPKIRIIMKQVGRKSNRRTKL